MTACSVTSRNAKKVGANLGGTVQGHARTDEQKATVKKHARLREVCRLDNTKRTCVQEHGGMLYKSSRV